MKHLGKKEYFADSNNKNDVAVLVMNIILVAFKIYATFFTPPTDNIKNITDAILRFIRGLICFMSIIKFFYYAKVDPDMAKLIRLIYDTVSYIKLFTIIFLIATCTFAILNINFKMDTPDDDYPNLYSQIAQFLYAFRNSIGDLNTPGYGFWSKNLDKNPYGYLMIFSLWVVYLLTIYFMVIMLLNFLIALVSVQFEETTAAEILNMLD